MLRNNLIIACSSEPTCSAVGRILICIIRFIVVVNIANRK